MSMNKKPWGAGEWGHNLASMASLYLDTFGPESPESLAIGCVSVLLSLCVHEQIHECSRAGLRAHA